MKIGFVILHFCAIEDTKKCVASIMKNVSEAEYEIVIIDNASPDKSGKILEKIYKKNKNINVIINEKNMGFARGNNVGFEYAKRKLKCDFIILLNNDTYLIQNDLDRKIMDEYNKSEFAVMGPKILLKGNKVQPVENKLFTVNEMKKFLLLNYIILFLSYFRLYDIVKKIFNGKKKISMREVSIKVNERQEDVILHGCFLIFSPQYINKFDGLDDRTFLYCEEHLLYLRLKKSNLLSVYNPNVIIFHSEDAATNTIARSDRKKNIFVSKNKIKSGKILLSELKKYNY